MKLEVLGQIFEKSSTIKFHENPFSGSRVVLCGRTDRHDEGNIRFLAVLRTRLKESPKCYNFKHIVFSVCVLRMNRTTEKLCANFCFTLYIFAVGPEFPEISVSP